MHAASSLHFPQMSSASTEMFEAIDALVQTFEYAVSEMSVPILVQMIRQECAAVGIDAVVCGAMLDILQLWDGSEDMTADFNALAKKMDRSLFLSMCDTMEQIVTEVLYVSSWE